MPWITCCAHIIALLMCIAGCVLTRNHVVFGYLLLSFHAEPAVQRSRANATSSRSIRYFTLSSDLADADAAWLWDGNDAKWSLMQSSRNQTMGLQWFYGASLSPFNIIQLSWREEADNNGQHAKRDHLWSPAYMVSVIRPWPMVLPPWAREVVFCRCLVPTKCFDDSLSYESYVCCRLIQIW